MVEIRVPERSKNRNMPRSKGGSSDSGFDELLPDLDRLTGATKKGRGNKIDPEAAAALVRFRSTLKKITTQTGGEEGEYRSDLGTKNLLQAMLDQVVEMIPIAAAKYIEQQNEPAAYAFNALANQAKDINSALRSLQTLEEQADYIVDRIMTAAFIQSTQNLVNGWMSLKPSIDNYEMPRSQKLALKELIDDLVRQHGKYMDEQMKAVHFQIKQYLLGETAETAKPRKRA